MSNLILVFFKNNYSIVNPTCTSLRIQTPKSISKHAYAPQFEKFCHSVSQKNPLNNLEGKGQHYRLSSLSSSFLKLQLLGEYALLESSNFRKMTLPSSWRTDFPYVNELIHCYFKMSIFPRSIFIIIIIIMLMRDNGNQHITSYLESGRSKCRRFFLLP